MDFKDIICMLWNYLGVSGITLAFLVEDGFKIDFARLNLIVNILFIGLLLFISYKDIKYRIVENRYILYLCGIALVYKLIEQQYYLPMVGGLLFLGIGIILWQMKIVGGGDSKLLVPIGIILPYTTNISLLRDCGLFFRVFGLVGVLWAYLFNILTHSKEVPFVPAILISYLIFIFFF